MTKLERAMEDAKDGKVCGPYKSVDEMMEKWEKEKQEDKKKHPIRHRVYYNVWLPVYRLWNNQISMIPSEIKWWFQRANRGWSDRDNWCIHYYNSKVMKEMLIDYKNNGHLGIPNDMFEFDEARNPTEEEENKASEKWQGYLVEMIYAFTEAEKIGNGDLELYHEINWREDKEDFRKMMEEKHDCIFQTKEQYERMQEGFRLFYTHYFSLWD